ncbi:hypothetical protein NEMIN01_1062 [Nematocida minor]|uniref:uncharacterized protein n=1 Tax=Nematocida minor TaxID=1912983 RepID=UPI00221EC88C|nr:uncharacterized protein NEMIN01_1062 [Nematocida minor]KAI5190524.1 hypothetical protein NEMIN01_1062 [Nematocida minor]
MSNPERDALTSLHNITEALSEILHKLSQKEEPAQETEKFLESFESLKEYFEKLTHEESLPGQDLGIDALSNQHHLEHKY